MSFKETGLKNIFMGNITLKSKIKEVSFSKQNFTNDITKIFNKICSSGSMQIGNRNKLQASNDSFFFFTICSNNIFYLIATDKNFPEHEAFSLVDLLHQKGIFMNVNESNELNSIGEELLNDTLNEYKKKESSSTIINNINEDIKDIKDVMKNNLKEVLKTTDDARALEVQSNNIKLGALEYQENANELKKATCWQNFKWTIIIGGVLAVVIGVVLIIVLR